MNKKLLTLAVGAALAAGMSVAQAEVAVYGKAHASIDMIDNDAGSEQTFISDNSSRIGVRVNEDLGGGLKALAQWEISTRTDIANAMTPNRNSFLGLGSDAFGTLRVGKYDTPYKDIGRKADLFNERVGDTRNVIGLGSVDGAFDARPSNMVRYDSPSFGGLQVALLHKSGAEETSVTGAATGTTVTAPADTSARYNSASVSYQGGPLFAAFGYETHDSAGSDDETGMRLGLGYKTGALTVNFLYETLEDVGGTAGLDWENYGVGAAFKFGNATAKAQYFISDETDAGDDASNLMAVGLDYAFTKTVTAYVAYAQVDNDPGAAYNVASANGGHGDTLAVGGGTTPSAFSVGMEMNF